MTRGRPPALALALGDEEAPTAPPSPACPVPRPTGPPRWVGEALGRPACAALLVKLRRAPTALDAESSHDKASGGTVPFLGEEERDLPEVTHMAEEEGRQRPGVTPQGPVLPEPNR